MGEQKKYKIGYCPGAFDMFHRGHLNLLKNSKDMCDYLIAGVVTDEVYTSYKLRPPVVPFEDRLEIVSQCKYVDEAVAVTPYLHNKWNAYQEFKYDAHFAGSDHAGEWADLEKALNDVGSDLVFFPYTQTVSSTDLKVNLEKDGIYREITGEQASPIVLLFGAGQIADRYLSAFVDEDGPMALQKNKCPHFIVDNDSSKWGQLFHGLEIKSPTSILNIPGNQLCILIASAHRKEIANQLIEMGISDYRFIDENILPTWENIQKHKEEFNKQGKYHVTDKMKKIRRVQLDILAEIDAICEKHNIKYYALYGTLLGAVRHKGYIPWDDDLDIGMLRSDYERFLRVATTELPSYYSLQTVDSCEDIIRTNARVCDSRTTAIEEIYIDKKCKSGIWVDIDPIDDCPVNDDEYRKKTDRIRRMFNILYAKIEGKNSILDIKKDSFFKYWLTIIMARVLSREKITQSFYNAITSNRSGAEERGLGILFAPVFFRQLNREDFQSTIQMRFEDRMIPVPVGYNNCLFALYGSDYMNLPPEEEQKPKHRAIIDPDRGYIFYDKLFCNIFDGAKDKAIILFGAGQMFDDYMRKFGAKYRPLFTVDNDSSKWGRTRLGIDIRNPEDILTIPESKRKVIICSFYYREIEKQLQEMGVSYSVYVQHVEWIVESEKGR